MLNLPAQFLFLAALIVLLTGCGNSEENKGTSAGYSLSKNTPADSLLWFARRPERDTLTVQSLAYLSWQIRRDNPDSAIVIGEQARSLADSLKYIRGLSYSNNILASAYRIVGDYEKAVQYNKLSYLYASQYGDSAQMSSVLGNLGTVYLTQGNYPQAMEKFLEALKLAERLNDSVSIATDLGNIATVFIWQNTPDSSVKYFYEALKYDQALKDSGGISFDLNGIAAAYGKKNMVDSALFYYRKVFEIEKSSGTKYGMEKIVGNLGVSWTQQADFAGDPATQRAYRDSAISYFKWAIRLANELGDRRGVALNTGNMGRIYTQINKPDSAEVLLLEAIRLTDSLGVLEANKDNQLNLSLLYDTLGRYKEALTHYRYYIIARDSLVNENKTAQMTQDRMNFEFDKQKAVDQAKNAEVLARQQLMLNFAVGGGILLLIVAVVSIRGYRNKKRSGEIIAAQKKEVENQKLIVESKQKEIIDSINYAQRIQSAILPAQTDVTSVFPQSFIVFMPKDIVSGDFYWMAKTDEYNFICAADCTGHGVPGGFMSMLGHSMLNEVVLEKKITASDEILGQVRTKVINALKQKGQSGENKDGMDLALCRFSSDFRKISFSLANNPLWICREGTMIEFKADKQPVGISPLTVPQPFTRHDFDLQSGDCVYIFTDGYADQFGGPKGKKFKYKPLMDLLIKNSRLPMQQQKEQLLDTFSHWKGQLAQIDDVLVIGIKI